MKKLNNFKTLFPTLHVILFILSILIANGQVPEGVFVDTLHQNGTKSVHQVKLDKDYFIYTIYKIEPAIFIKTLGGFTTYTSSGTEQVLKVSLEFNSDFIKDSIKQLTIPIKMLDEKLHLNLNDELTLDLVKTNTQDIEGKWLFATRGPDTGQDRRGEENSRKTLKFLKDGTFQWIAFDTKSFKFSGTGGGSYSAEEGKYTEIIEYFSRDPNRVGATLQFDYHIKGKDWHHTGNNSKGEPLYEIWSKR